MVYDQSSSMHLSHNVPPYKESHASLATIYNIISLLLGKGQPKELKSGQMHFIGSVCRTVAMHQLLRFKSKFPNHFAFTLGLYLFLLFLVLSLSL